MEYKEIGKLFSCVARGKSPKYVDNSDVCIINQACIRWDGIDYSKVKYQDSRSYREEACLHEGDVLLTSTGTGTLGRCCVFHSPDQRIYVADSHVTILHSAMGILPDIVCLYLRTQMGQNRLYSECVNGSTNQIELSKDKFRKFVIPVPTVTSQKALASKITHIEKIIELSKRERFELDNLVKARFVEMFGDADRFKRIPLGESVEQMFIGPFGSSLKNECFVDADDGYCMVYEQKHAIKKTMDVDTRFVTERKYNELRRFTVQGGDIIVSCRGTIGETFIVPEEAPMGIMHPSIMKIRIKEDSYDRVFFNHLLQTVLKRHEAEANGSGVKMAITATALGKDCFIIPPMELQHQFAAFAAQLDKSKAVVQQALDEAQTLFDSLMQQYFG